MTASRIILVATAACGLMLVTGCSSDRVAKLRAALDQSTVSLADSVKTAEVSFAGSVARRAELDVAPQQAVYAVNAQDSAKLRELRIDILKGQVLQSADLGGSSTDACPGSIPLDKAIAIAEAQVNGKAVLVQPDDDDACDREVQVLVDSTLWEVKVAPSGSVLEVEESDDD